MNRKDSIWPGFTSICIFILTVVFAWLMLIDGTLANRPVTYWEGCFGAEKTLYHPGDAVSLRIVATKAYPIHGAVTWALVNAATGQTIPFAERPTMLDAGYSDRLVQVAVIPKRIDPGRYYMEGGVVFPVNEFRSVTYHLRSDEFEVSE